MIIAIRKLGLTIRSIENHLKKWKHPISRSCCIGSIIRRIEIENSIENYRHSCGRKQSLGKDTKQKMIEVVLENREITASYILREKELNHNNVSVRTIERMLNNEELKARRPVKCHKISEVNKVKRV